MQVQTLAGDGKEGFMDGSPTQSRFNKPQGIALDSKSSYLYACDYLNNKIRKISVSEGKGVEEFGRVFAFAGNRKFGLNNGSAEESEWRYPFALTFDWNDNLLVTDTLNSCVRRITKEGEVETLAGQYYSSYSTEYKDGSAEKALFSRNLYAIATIKETETIFVFDGGNNCIRKIQNGKVDTFIHLSGIVCCGICSDDVGNIYFTDLNNHVIRKISKDKKTTILAGIDGKSGFKNGSAAYSEWNNPRGIVYDPDTQSLYVADSNNNRVRRITRDGEVSTVAGNGIKLSKDGIGNQASFNLPEYLALDSQRRVLYVSEEHGIRMISLSSQSSKLEKDLNSKFVEEPSTQIKKKISWGEPKEQSSNENGLSKSIQMNS